MLRNGDSGVGSSPGRRDLGGHLNGRGLARAGHGEPLAAQGGLLLEDPLDIGVTGRLLQLLTVHSVTERIHHSDL